MGLREDGKDVCCKLVIGGGGIWLHCPGCSFDKGDRFPRFVPAGPKSILKTHCMRSLGTLWSRCC